MSTQDVGYSYIINCLAITTMIGMAIKIFFGSEKSPTGEYGPASSTIWGFGLVAFSVVTLLFVSYSLRDKISRLSKTSDLNSFGKFLYNFLGDSLPSLITLITLFWIISLNLTFFKRINQGDVADEYYSLTNGSSFLFAFQIICLFIYLKEYIHIEKRGTQDKSEMTRIKFAIYFIALINLMITGMMTIILYLFSTDG